jgi:hypothetical protein
MIGTTETALLAAMPASISSFFILTLTIILLAMSHEVCAC